MCILIIIFIKYFLELIYNENKRRKPRIIIFCNGCRVSWVLLNEKIISFQNKFKTSLSFYSFDINLINWTDFSYTRECRVCLYDYLPTTINIMKNYESISSGNGIFIWVMKSQLIKSSFIYKIIIRKTRYVFLKFRNC